MNNSYATDRERWARLDIFNQMGNIYSEVGRTFKTHEKFGSRDNQEAILRAIDLFDATIDGLIAQRSPRSKEVLRAKEQFLNIASDKNANKSEISSLDRYFLQFAIAARLNR